MLMVAAMIIPSGVGYAQSGLEGLYAPPVGQARGVSSSTEALELNADSVTLAAGETIELAALDGRGIITRIAMAVHSNEPFHRRLLMLRMYWDGETQPSVEAPIGDFFGVGHGLRTEMSSYVVENNSGGRSSAAYWPMPFRKSARITLTNEGELAVDAIYFSIDWTKGAKVPRDTPYFHAEYRQEFPTVAGEPYVVADIEGAGRYVGTVLSVRKKERGWWGEGDPFFYIDGEATPGIRGTATDDYFGQTSGLSARTGLYTGAPHVGASEVGGLYSMYRWHIHDAMNFEESFRLVFEHKGFSQSLEYRDREDDFASVAFWYQAEPHHAFAGTPEGYGRLYVGSLIEGAMASELPGDEKASQLRDYLRESAIVTEPVRLSSVSVDSITFLLTLNNTTSVPLTVTGSLPSIQGVEFVSESLELQLAPRSSKEISVEAKAVNGAMDWRAINAIETEWLFVYPPPFNDVVETSVRHFLRADAPYVCAARDGEVVIDGDLKEWDALPFQCDTPQQVRVQYADWTNGQDGSFRFATAYDDDFVYVAVETVDDLFRLSPMEDPWWQDGIEIRLDARPAETRNTWNASAGEFDEFLFFALTPTKAGEAPIAVAAESLPAGARCACVRTKTGYATEVAIPHAALDAAQGGPWTGFRLNVAVNDLDADFSQFSQIWWRPDWRYVMSYDGSGTFTRD